MTTKVNPIPTDLRRTTPYLIVERAADALAFYGEVFGATEVPGRLTLPDGRIGHVRFEIGDSLIVMADESPEQGLLSPPSRGGSATLIVLYVEDTDATIERAWEAGATVLMPATDMFYGDRAGRIQDPFGHIWTIASRIEELAPEELGRRMAAMAAAGGD